MLFYIKKKLNITLVCIILNKFSIVKHLGSSEFSSFKQCTMNMFEHRGFALVSFNSYYFLRIISSKWVASTTQIKHVYC